MKIQIKQNLVGGIVFLIFSSLLWWFIPTQIVLRESAEAINSQTFPRIIVGLMWLCSAILVAKEIVLLIQKKPVKVVSFDLGEEYRAFILIALLIAYWFLLDALPFLVASLIFVNAFLLLSRCRNWKYYAIVCTTVILVSVVFEHILHVKLP
ncbi:tripartite tricarboxylate transporter TctB family protein [Spirabiliibacterium falconis]|uniref:tripartite tricarboxylate transporter TctB family protein n=1 Tax=Spirabiliibacterium falconis TaxID=572023 RepID=UPI001AAD7F17|nr:tripartite tricarboxylate transporter TctB family protein [Spirabiliibacterium falconis]MBE2893696.1 tripartite tricarboxylate transporter TctB family protein [Spirabiliibacterium falconis]